MTLVVTVSNVKKTFVTETKEHFSVQLTISEANWFSQEFQSKTLLLKSGWDYFWRQVLVTPAKDNLYQYGLDEQAM